MRSVKVERKLGSYKLDPVEAEQRSGIAWNVDRANLLAFDPTKKQKIPKTGAWVMITRRLPPIEGGIDEKVRVGRMFYACHHDDADEEGFRPNGMYAVRITTPEEIGSQGRDLTILPYEYSIIPVEEILALWTTGEIIFHPRNVGRAQLDATVFYARSRGIAVADAMVMALGTLSGDVGWFEPLEEIAVDLEAMEERVNRWKPRRSVKQPMEIILNGERIGSIGGGVRP